MAYDTQAGMSGVATGAAIGTAIAPGVGTAVGAGIGAGMGFFGSKKPDYSMVTDQYNKRQAQIGAFAANLAKARARYMTSLNNMYNDAYSRFSGNAEAGFASRGLSVSGGAFASTLAREAGRMSFEGANLEAGMEREDLRAVDAAYGGNSGGYMSAISGGPGMSFGADREDMRSIGSFAGKLAMQYTASRGENAGTSSSDRLELENINKYGPVGGWGK